jgi:hypothetical protein
MERVARHALKLAKLVPPGKCGGGKSKVAGRARRGRMGGPMKIQRSNSAEWTAAAGAVATGLLLFAAFSAAGMDLGGLGGAGAVVGRGAAGADPPRAENGIRCRIVVLAAEQFAG